MIPLAQITQWRQIAPWNDDIQVEQDLILSRAIIDIFSNPFLAEELAFLGGTALHKLFLDPAARYSEDIDLVRTSNGGISKIANELRKTLEPWLGPAKTKTTNQSFKMYFYFSPEGSPTAKQRVKVEINTRETFCIADRIHKEFSVQTNWFSEKAHVHTFQIEELLASKLLALYGRKKGRDAFDLWLAIKEITFNPEKMMSIFNEYMMRQDKTISKKLFFANLDLKLEDPAFLGDITPLLSPRLLKSHSLPLHSQDNLALQSQSGANLMNDGWNLREAVDVIKDTLLIHLAR